MYDWQQVLARCEEKEDTFKFSVAYVINMVSPSYMHVCVALV